MVFIFVFVFSLQLCLLITRTYNYKTHIIDLCSLHKVHCVSSFYLLLESNLQCSLFASDREYIVPTVHVCTIELQNAKNLFELQAGCCF